LIKSRKDDAHMEFSTFVITPKGQALMAKLMQGVARCDFTNIKLSSHAYTDAELVALETLADVKQSAPITSKSVISVNAIKIRGAIDNLSLVEGYAINTIGVFATDPDEGEILYAVARATVTGWMPPYNGVTVSGAYFEFAVTIGNASQVELIVDPAGYASIGDLQEVQEQIEDIKGFIGLNDDTVYGVEVDFVNKTFTRLAGASGRQAGEDWDNIEPWGGRYRCNLTDGGVELSAYGEDGYTETGALTAAVTKGGNTYAVGTKVQVMVKQPRFYYRVVPLKTEKIPGKRGAHMRKARYYISATPKAGFKLHPAFISGGVEKSCIYLSAYEGSLYDKSATSYISDDSQVADFTASTGDQLSSVAGKKPLSGKTQDATRRKVGILAENRGTGWCQSFVQSAAATEMLFLVEYASFNMQDKIGEGAVNKTDDGSNNMAENTGATSILGNASGAVMNANNIQIVSYRGEENFYGNIWKWVDGMNIYADTTNGDHQLFIANDKSFAESKNNGNYELVNFTACMANGYVSAFGYDPEFDWLFIASEVDGNDASSSVPVGDYYWQASGTSGYHVSKLGASWSDGLKAGGFYWTVDNVPSYRIRSIGGRLAYVPAL